MDELEFTTTLGCTVYVRPSRIPEGVFMSLTVKDPHGGPPVRRAEVFFTEAEMKMLGRHMIKGRAPRKEVSEK